MTKTVSPKKNLEDITPSKKKVGRPPLKLQTSLLNNMSNMHDLSTNTENNNTSVKKKKKIGKKTS
jgi:hypothetical protein